MSITLLRARQISLALLVIAVVDHGHLRENHLCGASHSSGLLRLGRDLTRRTSGVDTDGESALVWFSSTLG
jgi:hypothetical protein